MDIMEEFSQSQTLLVVMPGLEYNSIALEVAKQFSGKTVGYITLNKTFASIKEAFDGKKINSKNFVFVDAISRTIKEVEDTDQCYFVSSPAALTELGIKISKLLNHGFEYIVFDSVTNLAIYEKKAPVAKFLSNMVARVKASKSKAVFYAIRVGGQEALVQEAGMFVDRVVDISRAYPE